jgi:hypothetical protein
VLVAGGNLGASIITPIIALVLFGYDVLFEVLAQGRTPGKRWNGLRVVRGSGAPVGLRSSAIRNLIRILEFSLSYLPALISIIATERNQRLGDLAADTVVVRDRGAKQPEPEPEPDRPFRIQPAWERPDEPTRPAPVAPEWDVSAIGPEELAAVREFLQRRRSLPVDARRRVARTLDGALRDRVGGAAAEPDPERFLEGVVAAKTQGDRG